MLPQLIAEDRLNLSAYPNYRLLCKSGPLSRIKTATAKIEVPPKHNHREDRPHQFPATIRNVYEYFEEKKARQQLSPIDDPTDAKSFRLPSGRYESPARRYAQGDNYIDCLPIVLNLFPSGAVKAEYQGQSVILTPRIDETYRGLTAGPASHAREIIFHPAANTLVIRDAELTNSPPRPHSLRHHGSAPPPTKLRNSASVFRVNLESRTG